MKKIVLSLSLVTVALISKAQTPCSELFFSEYTEGSANSKALEIFNPTGNAISLSNYRIVRYSNGSAIGTDSTNLTSTASIAAYSTFVIANGVGVTSGTTSTSPACAPALQAVAQQLDGPYPVPTFMNGDDAIILARKSPYARIDIFGKIGQQPTYGWTSVAPFTDGATNIPWTENHTLIRKASIKMGVTSNPSLFNVTLQWDSLPNQTWSNLGSHVCDCTLQGVKENTNSVFLKLYPNPTNGNDVAFVSDNVINEINIVNAVGQIIISHKYITADKTVVLRNMGLANGIYYAVIKTALGSKTEKLIIQ